MARVGRHDLPKEVFGAREAPTVHEVRARAYALGPAEPIGEMLHSHATSRNVHTGSSASSLDQATTESQENAFSSPFPLDHANASRYKAEKQLLALEDHIRVDPCPACMSKHLTSAITFLEEASGLDGGTKQDAKRARTLEAMRDTMRENRWQALPMVRKMRAELAKQVGHVK